MARQQRDATFDAALQFKDVGSAVTASAWAQVATVNKALDFGAARFDGRCIVDVSAIKTSATDESYRIRLQVSNDSTFATGVVEAVAYELGAPAATGSSAADAVGRRELAFCNEVNGVTYRYGRVFTLVSGTAPTITYAAYAVQNVK